MCLVKILQLRGLCKVAQKQLTSKPCEDLLTNSHYGYNIYRSSYENTWSYSCQPSTQFANQRCQKDKMDLKKNKEPYGEEWWI